MARRARRRLDVKLQALGPAARYTPPPGGWVRAVRDALGMSQADLAGRMQVSAQAVQQIETSERDGTVRLGTLRRAADAMGCDLAYVLLPRTTLEDVVLSQATRVATVEADATARTMALEAQDAVLPQEVLDDVVDRLIASKRLWRA